MKTLMIATVALLSLMALASSAPHRSYYQVLRSSNSMTIYKYYDQLNDALEQSNGKYFLPTPCTRK